MPCDFYINSGIKAIFLFEVRNIEGQNHSEHTEFIDNSSIGS